MYHFVVHVTLFITSGLSDQKGTSFVATLWLCQKLRCVFLRN